MLSPAATTDERRQYALANASGVIEAVNTRSIISPQQCAVIAIAQADRAASKFDATKMPAFEIYSASLLKKALLAAIAHGNHITFGEAAERTLTLAATR